MILLKTNLNSLKKSICRVLRIVLRMCFKILSCLCSKIALTISYLPVSYPLPLGLSKDCRSVHKTKQGLTFLFGRRTIEPPEYCENHGRIESRIHVFFLLSQYPLLYTCSFSWAIESEASKMAKQISVPINAKREGKKFILLEKGQHRRLPNATVWCKRLTIW